MTVFTIRLWVITINLTTSLSTFDIKLTEIEVILYLTIYFLKEMHFNKIKRTGL